MPRVRIPLGTPVSDGAGTSYLCFVEGYARSDGKLQARLAFALPDESHVHRSPLRTDPLDDEEALRLWAHALSADELERELCQLLEARKIEPPPPVPKHRC